MKTVKTQVHQKLVRDRIPEIIERNGGRAVITNLSGQDKLDALVNKLFEELDEFNRDPSVEELADLQEVLHALAYAIGSSPEAVEHARIEKVVERGSFDSGIFLIETKG